MDQTILLFPHKDIWRLTSLSLPYLSIVSIIEHTYRRNKTIKSNRYTALQFILSGIKELTKRINRLASIAEAYLHRSVRYMNTNDCKDNCKNAYQVVGLRMNGGNRP